MAIPTFRLIFLSTLIALLLSPLAIGFARRFNLMDVPGSMPHKRHDYPVALVGGWVLLSAVLIVGLPDLLKAGDDLVNVLWLSGIIFAFGVIDDRLRLSPPVKLLGQLVASVGLLRMGISVHLLPPAYEWLNILVTLVWLVGITNAFNFVDSMDGLAIGLAGISAAFFMLVSNDSGQADLSAFCAVLVGACIGVYFLNANPTQMFLGDAGSQWLGFVLAGIGIIFTPQGFMRSQSWFVPIMLVGMPIFDMILVIFSRARRRRPVYLADVDHTYHRMVAFGLQRERAVQAMHIGGLLLGSLAFSLLEMPPLWANIVFILVLVGGAALVLWMDDPRRWPQGK